MTSATIFPVLIGGVRFEARDQVQSNAKWLSALEQQHRQKTSFCLCSGRCDLALIIRLYSRSSDSRHYGLAKSKDTGLDHHPDCRFFGEGSESDDDGDALPAFEARDDGTTRAHLAFSLQLAGPVEPTGVPPSAPHVPKSTRTRASESALLFKLWRSAGLNVYRGQDRSWFKVGYAIKKAAEKIIVTSKGETLADYLLIACSQQDRLLTTHNQEVLRRAAGKPSRLMVIGRMRALDPNSTGNKLLPISDFATLPKALISALTIHNMIGRRPLLANLMESKTGHVVALTCIEPERGDWWKVLTTAVMPTSLRFVPVESSYEVEFEDYLVDQGRHFIKPIIVNEIGDQDKRPDFVLIDTVPRTRCEVWGMQTPDYLASKAKRLHAYANQGQRLISWSADPREPFPDLPPINNY